MCVNICKLIYKYIFPSIASSLKCTPSDRHIYPRDTYTPGSVPLLQPVEIFLLSKNIL